MLTRNLAGLSAFLLLAGCSVQAESIQLIEFFAEADLASNAARCDIKPESDWAVNTFTFEDLEHTAIRPQGVICARDNQGKVVKVYLTESNRTSTHRLVEGTTYGVFPMQRFERHNPGQKQPDAGTLITKN